MIQHWPVNRDFFAFCKEVLPYQMIEIKRLYVRKLRAEG